MHFTLNNKTAIITGGASGIGLAVAERFVSAGVKVAIIDLDCSSLDSAFLEKNSIICQSIDISDEQAVCDGLQAIEDQLGKIDIMINNAGIAIDFDELSNADMQISRKTFEVNYFGTLHCLKYAPRHMRNGGSIINTASASAYHSFPNYGSYSASKAAVVSLTKTCAIELAEHSIRVNAVCPSTVTTPMEPQDSDESVFMQTITPLGRVAQTDDVVGLYHFLAADESRFISGQSITIDGAINAGFSKQLIKICS